MIMRLTKFLLPFILLTILISGCLNYTQITTLKTDNSGTMFIHYWMEWKTEKDSLLIEKLGIFEKDSIAKEFSSDYNKITNVEVYRDFTDSTVHAKVEMSFDNLDSLNHAKAFRDANFSIKDGPDNLKIFSQFIQPIATGFGFNSKAFAITYVYYLPGEILSHNATSISNNKLTWQYNLDEIGTGKYITATYRPFKLKETPEWIYYSALFVLVVVIIFLFRKK